MFIVGIICLIILILAWQGLGIVNELRQVERVDVEDLNNLSHSFGMVLLCALVAIGCILWYHYIGLTA